MMFALLFPYLNFFASTAHHCAKPFLGLTPWYGYFPDEWFGPNSSQHQIASCQLNNNFQFLPSGAEPSGLLLVGLAVLDDLIRIAALVAVGYVIYGGIQYVTSQGSPDATNQARQTIINALVGVTLAILAASIVTFIGHKVG